MIAQQQAFNQLLTELTPATRHRRNIFEQHLFGRLVGTLSETALEHLSNAIGKERCQTLLSHFFWDVPFKGEDDIVQNLKNFPDYIQSTKPFCDYFGIYDLAKICLDHWNLLNGNDPVITHPILHTAVDQMHLSKLSLLIKPQSEWSLWNAWNQSNTPWDDEIRQQHFQVGKKAGILFVKKSSIELASFEIDESLYDFCNALMAGLSIHEAVSKEQWDDHKLNQMQHLIFQLCAQQVLVHLP